MNVYQDLGSAPIKAWTDGVELEDEALQQLRNVARLPIIHARGIAVMPDVHWGIGATIGSVIPTVGAVIPAAVGVDIGCFLGSTRIPLLDGTQATLEDLALRTKPFWVYSIANDLNIAPGRATARMTRQDAELVRVEIGRAHV